MTGERAAVVMSISDDEAGLCGRDAGPFRFLDLPGELRNKIYRIHLLVDPVTIDLEPRNFRRIAPRLRLLQTCRQVHEEAYRVFYGNHTFRLFPMHGRFFYTKRPLLARLSPLYRAVITSLELRLGPGWTDPPKTWAIKAALGLEDTISLRDLNVFVECDPSHPIFTGFRKGQDYYTGFCARLLRQIIIRAAALEQIHFDAFPSVSRQGSLMSRLMSEAKLEGKEVVWSPTRMWD